MLTLKEGFVKNGNIQKWVLGTPKTAEMVVEWSKHHKQGEQFTRCLLWGLVAVAHAAGAQPVIQFFLKEDLLAEFLEKIAPLESMYLSGMGISACLFSQPGEPAQVQLYLETEADLHRLHVFEAANEQHLIYLGQMVLTLEGPQWLDPKESEPVFDDKAEKNPTPQAPAKKKAVALPIDKYETLPDLPEVSITADIDPGEAEDAEEAWERVVRRASGRVGR